MKTLLRLTSMLGAGFALIAHADTNTPPTIRLSGTVVDAEGLPVAGALIESYQQTELGQFIPPIMEVKQRATTQADGTFELHASRAAPFPMTLVARKSGLAVAWKEVYWNLTTNLTEERLVLTRPTTLVGTVVDENDKPVPDAHVWVSMASIEKVLEDGGRQYSMLSSKPARDYFSTRTSADGQFRIVNFPANATAHLWVSAPGKVLRLPKRELDYITHEMPYRAGQQDIKLVVEPAGHIHGKVVAQDTGQPLAGARLTLIPADRSGPLSAVRRDQVESDAEGAFNISDVPAGSYRVRAFFGTNALPEWVADTVQLEINAGQTVRDLTISATKGGLLEVAVLGKDDRKPCPGVNVSAFAEKYQAGSKSGSNGIALLRLPAGEYQLSAYKEGSRVQNISVNVMAGLTNRVEIELTPTPKITGTVRDPDGKPVAGLSVSVFGGFGPSSGEVKTDTNGHYELTWDPQRFAGSQSAFFMVALDPERNLATAADIDDSTTTLDLRLEPGLILAGRVEDPDGKPLTNALLTLHVLTGNMGFQFGHEPIKTDKHGRFEITGLPPDRRYYLWANAKGYGSANQQIERDNSETNRLELPPFILRAADRKLAGQVLDADEKPVPGAFVNMYGEGQPTASTRTDDKGRFAFDQVCEGQVRLSANLQGSYGTTSADADETNAIITLSVSRPYAREAPKRPSLKGKLLPDLADAALPHDALPAGRPLLLCLFDLEQRPSRRCVRLLAERHHALAQKGLTIAAIQATEITGESFQAWKEANPLPFPVGRVQDKSDNTKWISQINSLPWLILTDKERRVSAEGFAIDELEEQIHELPR
jgi:hypothetical protein